MAPKIEFVNAAKIIRDWEHVEESDEAEPYKCAVREMLAYIRNMPRDLIVQKAQVDTAVLQILRDTKPPKSRTQAHWVTYDTVLGTVVACSRCGAQYLKRNCNPLKCANCGADMEPLDE